MSSPRVHFTHHACRLEDPTLAAYHADASRSDRPSPEWSWCASGYAATARLTTSRAEVSCLRCLRGHPWRFSDEAHVLEAWIRCCVKRCPKGWPGSESSRLRLVAHQNTEAIKRLGDLTVMTSAGLDEGRAGDRTRKTVERIAASLEHDPRRFALAKPAMDEWLMAADLADEIGACRDRARRVLDLIAPDLEEPTPEPEPEPTRTRTPAPRASSVGARSGVLGG